MAASTTEESAYPVPSGEQRAEIEILKSRFLATVGPAPTEAAAQAFVARLRSAHPEAHHHCYAFVVGSPGSTRSVGFSDDGEPHNTAGRPMFDVLRHSGAGDIVAVVTRWFGGTKLGRGGLVRAYGDAVQTVLRDLETTPKVDWIAVRIELNYGQVDGVERVMPEFGAEVLEREYGAMAVLTGRVPRSRLEALKLRVADLTRGSTIKLV